MDTAKQVRPTEKLNWNQLESYLRKVLPELAGPLTVQQFHGGHANLTYLLTFGSTDYVLRRPPFGNIAPGAHDMKREWRVLSKLYRAYPRAPRAVHFCADESIIGAPFVLLERRTGVVVRTSIPAELTVFDRVEERLTEAMVRAQADLHLVDYQSVGLEELGRPAGFLQRQLTGWNQRWELVQTSPNADMTEAMKRLQINLPETHHVSIIHNDIKLDNCQFQPENPDRVTSVFDWDMCTLGDPLADFANTLNYFPSQNQPLDTALPVQLRGDFPDQEFLIEKYQRYTGFNLDCLAWYQAFANWKGAVIAQQLYKRYLDGATTDKRMAGFEKVVQLMARTARQKMEVGN